MRVSFVLQSATKEMKELNKRMRSKTNDLEKYEKKLKDIERDTTDKLHVSVYPCVRALRVMAPLTFYTLYLHLCPYNNIHNPIEDLPTMLFRFHWFFSFLLRYCPPYPRL